MTDQTFTEKKTSHQSLRHVKGSHDQAKPHWEISRHSYSVPNQITLEWGQGFMIQSSLLTRKFFKRESIIRQKLVGEQDGVACNPPDLGRFCCKRERCEARASSYNQERLYMIGNRKSDTSFRIKRPSLTIQAQSFSFNWPAILSRRLKAANAKGDSSIPSSANLRSKVSGTE